MFDSKFIETVLEKVGGKSATLVLQQDGTCVFASTATLSVLGIKPQSLKGSVFLDQVKFTALESSNNITDNQNPIYQILHNKNYIQTTPFFCKISGGANPAILAINTQRIVSGESDTQSIYALVQIRTTKREVDVGEMKLLFVSFAAHQLKTPSSVVKGFLELMMRQGQKAYSKEQWHYLISAFESNEQLIAVSKSLLNMARLEGGLIEPKIREFDPLVVLQTKIQSFVTIFQNKQISINFEPALKDKSYVAQTASSIYSDESFFSELFGILLGNAIKHSPEGEEITVTCTITERECEVHVIDNGAGIPDSVRAALFTEAQSSSDKENSHGLGLYMAKKYSALLGGSVGIGNRKKGSDFYFIIPNVDH